MTENKLPKRNVLSAQIDISKFELATEEEKRQQDVMSESTTFFKDGMKKLMKNPLAVLSLIFLAFIIIVILVAPSIVPYEYSEIISIEGVRDRTAKNLAPFQYSENELAYMAEGGEVFPHIMGTDAMCRDYFIRVVYGARVSLAVGLFASIIVLIIGLLCRCTGPWVPWRVWFRHSWAWCRRGHCNRSPAPNRPHSSR